MNQPAELFKTPGVEGFVFQNSTIRVELSTEDSKSLMRSVLSILGIDAASACENDTVVWLTGLDRDGNTPTPIN